MNADADKIIDIYRRHARAFAAQREKNLIEKAWLDRFLALSPNRGAILDIGCGAGDPIARYMLQRGRSVVGVDSSPELIALCKRSFPAGDWRIADMRRLSLQQAFAGLIAWDSFFHLRPDDQRGMFPIFRAHAAPGATLMFTSGVHRGVAMGEFEGEPLYHASLDGADYRRLLDENGFEVRAHAIEDPTCGGRTIWLAQAR